MSEISKCLTHFCSYTYKHFIQIYLRHAAAEPKTRGKLNEMEKGKNHMHIFCVRLES